MTDYLINILLVASVMRQLRGRRLTWFGLGWPIALVIWAAINYLRGYPTGGSNILLVVCGAVIGAILGGLCGRLSRVFWRDDDRLIVQATGAAALLWVLGTGSRLAFELYAEHGGYSHIETFDVGHHIAGVQTWATSLILMALGEVLARTAFLAPRLLASKGSTEIKS
ncbi:MAG: DUF1453 domain-containing protein [Gallionella sp.]|nr:DUF1453 domain-containing protein [Gallionella sp.]NNN07926.1 DUF1453 domain-containing protein [Acidimicrobiaceae bacterium]